MNPRFSTETAEILPDRLMDALAEALTPIAPAPERAAEIKSRLQERVRRDHGRFLTVRTTDGEWETFAPGATYKMLDDDGAMQAFLLRLEPGTRLPGHDHPGDEICLVLEGEVRLGDVGVAAGDYHLAYAGSMHGDIVTTTGALLYIRTASGAIPHRPA